MLSRHRSKVRPFRWSLPAGTWSALRRQAPERPRPSRFPSCIGCRLAGSPRAENLPRAGTQPDPRAFGPDSRQLPRLRAPPADQHGACHRRRLDGRQVRALPHGSTFWSRRRAVSSTSSEPARCGSTTSRYSVLDEADRMLDMGFIHDIRRIVANLPAAATDAAVLRHHAGGHRGTCQAVPARPGERRCHAGRQYR